MLTLIAPATQTAPTAPAPSSATSGPASAERGVVLVAGATGGVGKRVVGLLLAEGRRVRALVRDLDKARSMLVGGQAAGEGL